VEVYPARGLFRLVIIAALVLSLTAVSAARTRSTTNTSGKTHNASASKSTHSSSAHKSSAHKSGGKSGSSKSNSSKSARGKGKKGGGKAAGKKKPRGQQEIASERTLEIQNALIRERYMNGDASGVMDQSTKSALMKFQSDNGWQTRVVPDSRALIKLGLGPSREGLLNPDSAALAAPASLGVEKEIPGGR
jgi:hypothetical protein